MRCNHRFDRRSSKIEDQIVKNRGFFVCTSGEYHQLPTVLNRETETTNSTVLESINTLEVKHGKHSVEAKLLNNEKLREGKQECLPTRNIDCKSFRAYGALGI